MGEIKEVLWKAEDINWSARSLVEALERKPEVGYKSILSFTERSASVRVPTWMAIIFAVSMGSLATLAFVKVLG